MRFGQWLRQQRLVVVLGLAALFLSACTGAGNSKTTAVKLTLPDPDVAFAKARVSGKVGTLALTTRTFYSRIMINIQGGGLPAPIVHIQQTKSLSKPLMLNPQFDVPKGTSPNIQVLLLTSTVWIDEATGQPIEGWDGGKETFYYGDAMRIPMDSDFQTVPLSVSAMGVMEGANGMIAGRFIDADGTGPTGKVAVKIVPTRADGTLAPPMTVSQTEIHGGWFEFIAFQGLKFSYVFEDGTPYARVLLPGMNVDTVPAAGTLPQNQAFITVPAGFRAMYSSETEVMRTSVTSSRYWIGFFGPGAPATNRTCYDSVTGESLQYLYTSSTVGSTATVQWGASSPDATRAGVVSGGVAATDGNCGTAANYWSTWLKPLTSQLSDGHVILGNVGPFRLIEGSNGGPALLDTVHDGSSTLTLKWGYLPGTTDNGRIDGVAVFKRTLATAPNNNGGGSRDYELDGMIACNRLTDPTFFPANGPFQFVTQVPVTASSLQTTSLAGISSNDFNSGKAQVILCPYSNSRPGYYSAGIDMRSQGGGSGTGPATQVLVVGPSMNKTATSDVIATDVCTPLTLIPQDSSGRDTWLPPNPTIALSGSGTFYSDPACQSTFSSSQVQWLWSNGTSRALVYMMTTASSTFNVSATITAPASGNTPAINASGTLSLSPGTGGTPSQFKILGLPSEMMAFKCYPVLAVAQDSSGRVVLPTASPIQFADVATSKLFVYGPSDQSCQATSSLTNQYYSLPRPSPSPPLASAFVPLFMRYIDTTPVTTAFNVLNGITVGASSVAPANATIAQPGAPSKLDLMMPQSFAAEQCVSAMVRLVDSSGNETPPSSGDLAVTVNTNGSALFYDDMNCNSVSTPGPKEVIIPAGATQAVVRFRETSTTATTLSVSAGTGIMSSSRTISVSGRQVAKLVVTVPGQTYSSGVFSGSPALTTGTSVTVTISALSILGNAVNAGTSNYDVSITPPWTGASINFNGATSTTSINFAGGSSATATFTCTNQGSPVSLSGAALMAPFGSTYMIVSDLGSINCNN